MGPIGCLAGLVAQLIYMALMIVLLCKILVAGIMIERRFEMGFLNWLFGGVDHGDESFYATLQEIMLDELKQAGWLKATRSEFHLLGSDNGFFEDIYRIFTRNKMYDMLKDANPHAYLMSVSSTSMIAGLCAVELALNRNGPLYGAYGNCLQTFKNVPPLATLDQLYGDKHGGPSLSEYSLSQLIDRICARAMQQPESHYCSGVILRAVAMAFYNMGQTMGDYYN